MDVMSLYKRAWSEVNRELGSHVVLSFAFLGVNLVTGGLGALLLPNYLRELRAAEAGQRLPDVSKLFDFSKANSDIVNAGIYLFALFLGGWLAGIGATIAAVLLGVMMPMAAVDRYEPVDNAKLSSQHALSHIGTHATFFMVAAALVFGSLLLCGLPLIVVLPTLSVAQNYFYDELSGEIDALAADLGIQPKPALPDPQA